MNPQKNNNGPVGHRESNINDDDYCDCADEPDDGDTYEEDKTAHEGCPDCYYGVRTQEGHDERLGATLPSLPELVASRELKLNEILLDVACAFAASPVIATRSTVCSCAWTIVNCANHELTSVTLLSSLGDFLTVPPAVAIQLVVSAKTKRRSLGKVVSEMLAEQRSAAEERAVQDCLSEASAKLARIFAKPSTLTHKGKAGLLKLAMGTIVKQIRAR